MDKILELTSSVFGLLFLILIIKEKRLGWIFGVIATSLSVYLFIQAKLYSEAILYSYYIVMGVYGFVKWSRMKSSLKVTTFKIQNHLYFILFGLILSFGLGYYFENNSDAARPYLDAFSTIFAFIATWLETKKKLGAWIYWIVLNTYSIFLYGSVDLQIKSIEMVIYAVFSFYGFYSWRKSYLSIK